MAVDLDNSRAAAVLGELGFRLASGQAEEGSDVEAPGSVVRAPARLCRLCGFPSEAVGGVAVCGRANDLPRRLGGRVATLALFVTLRSDES